MRYALTHTQHKLGLYSDRAYIDFNGYLTDEVIWSWERAHGFTWIKEKLINLLWRYQDTSRVFPVQTLEYYERDMHSIASSYTEETGEENIQVTQMFDDNDDWDEFWILEYKAYLPLWYIVWVFLRSHKEACKEGLKTVWHYKDLSAKELQQILRAMEYESFFTHEIWMIDLITGDVIDVWS